MQNEDDQEIEPDLINTNEQNEGDLEEEEVEEEEEDNNLQQEFTNLIMDNRICENCCRQQSLHLVNTYGSSYQIVFFRNSSDQIRNQGKFKHVRRSTTNIYQFDLCSECTRYLVNAENKKEAELTKNAWPAFVWTVLKNRKVHEIYGESIWQFIPQQWRYWWIEFLKTK